MAISSRIVLATIICFTSPLMGEDDNQITIYGEQNESTRTDRPGHTEVIAPKESSRFSVQDHIKEKINFVTHDTGVITPSGFLLPNSRGQSANNLSVYVDDFQIYDPLTGYPVVSHLDLQAFGKIVFHRGISSYSLSDTNLVGAIGLKNSIITKPSQKVGFSYGKPYGTSAYYYREDRGESYRSKIFLRQHDTNGKYKFYDNNGTPQNKSDDSINTRKDNNSHSKLLVPYYEKKYQTFDLKLMGVYSEGVNGIPSIGGRVETNANNLENSYNTFIKLKSKKLGSNFLSLYRIGLNLSYNHQIKKTTDEESKILFGLTLREQSLFGTTVSIPLYWNFASLQSKMEFTFGDNISLVESDKNDDLNRYKLQFYKFYWGLSFQVIEDLTTEIKIKKVLNKSLDSLKNEYTLNSESGVNFTLGYNIHLWEIYFQLGQNNRLPSLYEKFGDGRNLIGSIDLNPEETRHIEFGFFGRIQNLFEIYLSIYQDQTNEKIVFTPSLNNTFKALNLSKTLIQGFESELKLLEYFGFQAGLGGAFLSPYDLTTDNKYLIPEIPRVALNGYLAYHYRLFSARWSISHRGDSYADAREEQILPSQTLMHLNFDLLNDQWSFGMNIRNIADVKSLQYGESDQTSYVPLSEINGYPLPGRTWVLHGSYKW